MSRHRNVRNLDIDDVMAEDEFSDEEYDQNEGGEVDFSGMTEEDRAAMDDGVAHVYSVIGDDTSISLQTIQETLWYYYFDKEESVNFLLDMIAKQKSAQAKETAKAATAKGEDINRSIRKQRLALLSTLPVNQRQNGRPKTAPRPSTASSLSSIGQTSQLRQMRAAGSSLSSLRAKMANQKSSRTSLAALANPKTLPNVSEQKETADEKRTTVVSTGSSSLSALAQQSKAKGGSALQRLAARSKPEKPAISPEIHSNVSQPSPTLSATEPTSALAKLAQRHQNKPSTKSLTDLVKTSRLHSAAAPHSESVSSADQHAQKAANTSDISHARQADGKGKSEPRSVPTTTDASVDQRTANAESSTPQHTKPTMDLDSSYLEHPLCAPPSSVAKFLFTPLSPVFERLDMSQLSISTSAKSLNATIYQNMMPSNKNMKIFNFDAPSPDDTVRSAQSQRRGVMNKGVA